MSYFDSLLALKLRGGGGGGDVSIKTINNVSLKGTGNLTSSDLKLQDELESGINIKTLNNQSLLGEGNLNIEGGSTSFDIDTANNYATLVNVAEDKHLGFSLNNNDELSLVFSKPNEYYQERVLPTKDYVDENKGVFVAIAGQTTSQEIISAINDKKAILINNPRGSSVAGQYGTFIVMGYNISDPHITMYVAVQRNINKTTYRTYNVSGSTWTTDTLNLQQELQNGVNIKRINNQDLLGAGNIEIKDVFLATYSITTYAEVRAALETKKVILIGMTANNNLFQATYSCYVGGVGTDILLYSIFKSGSNLNLSTFVIKTDNTWSVSHDVLQEKLVSGTNLKTLNNQSLLGAGNIDIQGGSDVFYAVRQETTLEELLQAIDEGKIIAINNSDNNVLMFRATILENRTKVKLETLGDITGVNGKKVARITHTIDSSGWTMTAEVLARTFIANPNTTTYSLLEKAIQDGHIIYVNNSVQIMSGFCSQSYIGENEITLIVPTINPNGIGVSDDRPVFAYYRILDDNTWVQDTVQTATTEDTYDLQAQIDNLGEPFRVKKWDGNNLNISIPYITEDIDNTSIPKFDYTITGQEATDFQVAGMLAYEVFGADGKRINCMPVCQFTGNGQTTLSVRFMCAGTMRKTATKISAWVLLKHR